MGYVGSKKQKETTANYYKANQDKIKERNRKVYYDKIKNKKIEDAKDIKMPEVIKKENNYDNDLDMQKIINDPIVQEAKTQLNKSKYSEEPITKIINGVSKVLESPLVQNFLKGIVKRISEPPIEQQQNSKPQGIQPPEGWLSMDGMEKLKKKYNDPAWFNAGIKYDENVGHGIGLIAKDGSQVTSSVSPEVMRAAKETPLVHDSNFEGKIQKNQIPVYDDSNLLKIEDSPQVKKVESVKEELKKEEIKKENDEVSEMEAIKQQMLKDNEKYIVKAIEFIKSKTDKELIIFIDDDKKVLKEINKWSWAFPVQFKAMIQANEKVKIFYEMLIEAIPEKKELLEKNKLKLSELYTKVRSVIIE